MGAVCGIISAVAAGLSAGHCRGIDPKHRNMSETRGVANRTE